VASTRGKARRERKERQLKASVAEVETRTFQDKEVQSCVSGEFSEIEIMRSEITKLAFNAISARLQLTEFMRSHGYVDADSDEYGTNDELLQEAQDALTKWSLQDGESDQEQDEAEEETPRASATPTEESRIADLTSCIDTIRDYGLTAEYLQSTGFSLGELQSSNVWPHLETTGPDNDLNLVSDEDASLAIGDFVTIVGLYTDAGSKLNGLMGEITQGANSTGRYAVQVEESANTVLIKRCNLRLAASLI